jgi:hypothetical protein
MQSTDVLQSVTGARWRCVLVAMLGAVALCAIWPALGRAATTVTIGPPLIVKDSAQGCPTATFGPDEPYYDCTFANTRAPTPGTRSGR